MTIFLYISIMSLCLKLRVIRIIRNVKENWVIKKEKAPFKRELAPKVTEGVYSFRHSLYYDAFLSEEGKIPRYARNDRIFLWPVILSRHRSVALRRFLPKGL